MTKVKVLHPTPETTDNGSGMDDHILTEAFARIIRPAPHEQISHLDDVEDDNPQATPGRRHQINRAVLMHRRI